MDRTRAQGPDRLLGATGQLPVGEGRVRLLEGLPERPEDLGGDLPHPADRPGVGDERLSPPRPPRESIFNRLMIERTLVAEGMPPADAIRAGVEDRLVPILMTALTAALGLELAADGHIDLDVPVDTYLDVDLTDRYGPASTLRQLLQHRGGYPDAFVGSHHLEDEDAHDLGESPQIEHYVDANPQYGSPSVSTKKRPSQCPVP